MRSRLLWKLLTIPLLVLTGVLAAVWIAFDLQASHYFMTLMKEYGVDAPEVNEMFLQASHRTLIQTALVGLLLSAALCYFLTRRLLHPLADMRSAAARIAAGDYDSRVPERSSDELGDLARAFNRMATALSETERARRRMVVDVAHELRTPLTNLRGYVEALHDGLVAPDDRTLGILQDELLRMSRLAEDLLATARGAEGRPDFRPTNLGGLLQATLALFRPRLERARLEVRADLDGADQVLMVDPDRMVQVFSNLLENCLQFTPPGSWIGVDAERRENGMRLTFRNPGGHLGDDDLKRIFTPYYRAEKSRSRERGGAGLGLAIVESHVKAHGGRVGAASENGVTHVWIELPARAQARPSVPDSVQVSDPLPDR